MTGHQHPSCWLQHVPGSARWLIALGAWICFLLGFGYCVVDSDLGSGYGFVCFFHVIFLRYFCVLYAVCVSLYLCAILDDVFLGFFCFIAASAFVSWSFFCSFWHSSCSWHCLAFLLVSCSMDSGLLVVIVGIRLPQCFILFYFIFTSSILISSSHFPWTFCLTIFFSTSFFSFRWYIVPLFPLFSLSICSLLSCCPLLEIFLFFPQLFWPALFFSCLLRVLWVWILFPWGVLWLAFPEGGSLSWFAVLNIFRVVFFFLLGWIPWFWAECQWWDDCCFDTLPCCFHSHSLEFFICANKGNKQVHCLWYLHSR